MNRGYYNFIKSISNSQFTVGIPPDKNKPVFTPTSPKPISTKGDYCFYKDYFYDRKTGFEWRRTR